MLHKKAYTYAFNIELITTFNNGMCMFNDRQLRNSKKMGISSHFFGCCSRCIGQFEFLVFSFFGAFQTESKHPVKKLVC